MDDNSNWNKTVSRFLSHSAPGSVPRLHLPSTSRKKIAPHIPATTPKVEPVAASTQPDSKPSASKQVPKHTKAHHEKHKFNLNAVASVFGSNSFEKKTISGSSKCRLPQPKTESKHDTKQWIKQEEIKDDKELFNQFMEDEMAVVGDNVPNELFPQMLAGQTYDHSGTMDPSSAPAMPEPVLQQLLNLPDDQTFLLRVPSSLLKTKEGQKGLPEGPVARLRVRQSGKVEINLGSLEGHLTPFPLSSLHLPSLIPLNPDQLTLLNPPATCFEFQPSFTSVLEK